MPRGASPKREREYKELEDKFHRYGRYHGREQEVAARIVNKQRGEYGETKSEKKKDSQGEWPDRSLPISDYPRLTVAQVRRGLQPLSKVQLRQIEAYEKKHKNRNGVLQGIQNRGQAA